MSSRTNIQKLSSFSGILSSSPKMFRIFEIIKRVARTDSTVLVRGETGTGKELVARAIQSHSPRVDKPFRAINCATLTPELLASELFGHVKGSFTGAIRDRQGLFAFTHTGTIFLDEVAELPLNLQSQLLRVLQERMFVPVGSVKPKHTDVRVIAATNRALRREVAEGRFREDLMYRVRVVPIFLPPLIERDGDLAALLWNFVEKFNRRGPRSVKKISKNAMDAVHHYPWPGNVRELHNAVEYAFAIGEGQLLDIEDLPPELRGESPSALRVFDSSERGRILQALEQYGWRKGKAAESLGLSRTTLWRKMKEHEIVTSDSC